MAVLSTWQQFHLASHNLKKMHGGQFENGDHIGFFQSGS